MISCLSFLENLTTNTLPHSKFTHSLTHFRSYPFVCDLPQVLLVASIPVAIEIVCTTTLALGSRELSDEGAIVSRLAAIEDMAGQTRVYCHLHFNDIECVSLHVFF